VTFGRGLQLYRRLLEGILERGYDVRPLGSWVREGRGGDRTVVLRHDVDGSPRAAMRMAEIENGLGIGGTWYVRWRTARPEFLDLLRDQGLEVGLHYESLSRLARRLGAATAAQVEALVPPAAAYLEAEVHVFKHLFGGCPSICPHGDSGLPTARNGDLLRHADLDSLGVDFDARAAMAEAQRAGWSWLTDDRRARVRGMPPDRDPVTDTGGRVMLVVHPNNWVQGRRWPAESHLPDEPPV
jgi:hypothetical protein